MKKLKYTIVTSGFYPLLLFVISFVFVVLFSRSTSFLYVFEGGDPAIFKQMGLALLRGKTLYVDYFDNKGCILYFIQALGLWLGGDFFILLMQAFSLTVTLVIWDKMLALYRDVKERMLVLGIALILLLCFYQDGDLTEEWCLPFASYPLLVYFQSLKNKKEISSLKMFITGTCFGIIAFIRINNAAPFLGFMVYLWGRYLFKKGFNCFLKSISLFSLGMLIISGLCTLYFYLKAGVNGVSEMIYATFLSNFEYLGFPVKQKLFLRVFYYLFFALCVIQQILNSKKQRDILIPSLISYGFFIITFGNKCFTHYLMALMPLLVVGLMTLNYTRRQNKNIVTIALVVVSAFFYLPIPVALTINDLVLKNDKCSVVYNDFHRCIKGIPNEELDSIYNYNLYGSGVGLLQHEKRLQCNRVLFSSFAFNYKRLYLEETQKPFKAPLWIMISWDRRFVDDDARFVLENYDLYCDFPFERIYLAKPKVGYTFQVYLYRRKESIQ